MIQSHPGERMVALVGAFLFAAPGCLSEFLQAEGAGAGSALL